MKPQILYHDGCPDGFGAAFAAWLKFGDDADYHPCQYGQDPPILPATAKVHDDSVYILDFSYPRKMLLRLKTFFPNLLVIDHHKTAQADLEGLDFCIFDMEHSGATLAWAYFHTEPPLSEGYGSMDAAPMMYVRPIVQEDAAKAPLFFRYIEDRDLWRWALPQSKEFSAALFSYPRDFKTWRNLYPDGASEEYSVGALLPAGAAILRARSQFVEDICKGAFKTTIADYEVVPVANTSVLFSEVPTRLLELYPDAPFAASYRDLPEGTRVWSLRSTDDRVDVSEVAKMLGGGGHRNAAGFKTQRSEP